MSARLRGLPGHAPHERVARRLLEVRHLAPAVGVAQVVACGAHGCSMGAHTMFGCRMGAHTMVGCRHGCTCNVWG